MTKEQKQYEKQFKIDSVEYFLSQDKSARKIAEHFGVCDKTFYAWIREYKENGSNSFRGKGIIKASNEELMTLKKELADVKEERDILKKAIAIFSKTKK
jgi:transposase-like protein